MCTVGVITHDYRQDTVTLGCRNMDRDVFIDYWSLLLTSLLYYFVRFYASSLSLDPVALSEI